MPLEHVVQIIEQGRCFTFRQDERPPLSFWRVESEGRVFLSPFRVTGGEQPAFFLEAVRCAVKFYGL